MATALVGQVNVTTAFNYSKTTNLANVTPVVSIPFNGQISYANGTGAGQSDKIWTDSRTLTASSSEDLDLAGVLVDAFGATVTFARVKLIIIQAATGNTNNVVVGNAGSNQFVGPFGAATHTIAIRPGGIFAIGASDATSYVVTAATADLLHVANSSSGTSVTYNIIIVGSSA